MIDVSFPLLVEDNLAHMRQQSTMPIYHPLHGLSLIFKHLEVCRDLAMRSDIERNCIMLREELAITAALIQKTAEDCGLTILSE